VTETLRLFFDVDGVLIDGWHARPERRRRWDTTLQRDLGIDPEAFRARLFLPVAAGEPAPIERCSLGQADLAELLAGILPDLGYRGSAESLLDYWFAKDAVVNPAVLDAVERLRRHAGPRLYIATNQEHHRADYLWRVLAFSRHFDALFHSAALGVSKRDPAFFQAVDRALGGPGDSLLFDDTPEVCAAARAAGWDACLFDAPADLVGHPRVAALLAG